MNNAIDIFFTQFQCICTSSLSAAFNQDAVYNMFIHFVQVMTMIMLVTLSIK